MKLLLILLMGLVPITASAQTMSYEERAALAKDPQWQDRIGIAAQQQATIAQSENPVTCCQTSAQTALAPAKASTLCDLVIPPGSTSAPDYVQEKSVARHNARATLALDVYHNPTIWSQRIAGMISADACVTKAFTDGQIQAYLARLWDLIALTPELAAVPAPPEPEAPTPPTFRTMDPLNPKGTPRRVKP